MHGPHDQIGLMTEGRVSLLRDGESFAAYFSGLAHARVEPRVGHEGIRRPEPMDVADLREDPQPAIEIDSHKVGQFSNSESA